MMKFLGIFLAGIEKVMIIGLDCFEPSLAFERWRDKLPNLSALMDRGTFGKLESTIPAITVPAWMSMMTSRSPGAMGFYGFRNRKNYSYDDLFFANSTAVTLPTVWQILSKKRKKVIVLGVPQTYPPKPVNGNLVGCFLTPSIETDYTYPSELKDEIRDNIGEYILDVKDFRTDDKNKLVKQIYQMTDVRFQTAEYLIKHKPWDFFMMVDMGPDRLHHGMWKYHDKNHVNYPGETEHKNCIRDFYIFLDNKIGGLLKKIDLDKTAVFVVSDHGAKSMEGGFCFNDWLLKEGYLKLKLPVTEPKQITNDDIDWKNTKVWGYGGYYGRLFINVKGRETEGLVPQNEYENFRSELKKKLESISDHKGKPMGNIAFKPDEVYSEVNGIAPDLIVYFGDLRWRSIGTVGNESLYTFENDTGPDDANHAQHGLYISSVPGSITSEANSERHITDIAPTILNLLNVRIPPEMEGRSII